MGKIKLGAKKKT